MERDNRYQDSIIIFLNNFENSNNFDFDFYYENYDSSEYLWCIVDNIADAFYKQIKLLGLSKTKNVTVVGPDEYGSDIERIFSAALHGSLSETQDNVPRIPTETLLKINLI